MLPPYGKFGTLCTGEDEVAFEDKLRRIAKVKPKPEADAKAEDDEAPE